MDTVTSVLITMVDGGNPSIIISKCKINTISLKRIKYDDSRCVAKVDLNKLAPHQTMNQTLGSFVYKGIFDYTYSISDIIDEAEECLKTEVQSHAARISRLHRKISFNAENTGAVRMKFLNKLSDSSETTAGFDNARTLFTKETP